MSKKVIFFFFGLAGVTITPFFFQSLCSFIQNHGPARLKSDISLVYHVAFWLIAFAWAFYFGVWVRKSSWDWFETGAPRRKFYLILAAAVLIRLAVILLVNLPQVSDAGHYDQLAVTLAQTGNYEDGGKPTAFRPVGYVAFLAGIYRVFGHNLWAAKLANLLLDVFSLLVLWKLFAFWEDEKTALKATGMVAFFVPEIYSTQNLLSEQFFVFLWILSIYLWEKAAGRKVWSFFSGIFFGLSALVRPVALVWSIIPAIIAVQQRRWVCLSAFLLMTAAVTAPWVYRNHDKFGRWALSTHAGLGFWMGANPQANGHYFMPDSLPFDLSDQGKAERTAWKLGWDYVRSHPLEYLRLGLVKEAVLFGLDYNFVFDLYEKPSHKELIWGIAGQAYWWILLFFGTIKAVPALFLRRKRAEAGSLLPIWTLLCWAAVHFFFVGVGRYHHPVVPFFAFLAALTFSARQEER